MQQLSATFKEYSQTLESTLLHYHISGFAVTFKPVTSSPSIELSIFFFFYQILYFEHTGLWKGPSDLGLAKPDLISLG